MKNVPARNLILLTALLVITSSPPALSVDLIVPDTGQRFCYDWDSIICDVYHEEEGFYEVCDSDPCPPGEGEDFYGQDAHYSINPPQLTDNGDSTVTDNLTGLIWEQKTEESAGNSYTYGEAVSYCDNLSLGGNNDWRVPTRREFSTILNLGRLSPALDTTYFPYFDKTSPSAVYYWTSSEYHDDPTQVWKMQLSFGIIETEATSQLPPPPYKVRCVRGDALPAARYTNNGNGTVTDKTTGLMWEQKTADGGSRDREITLNWKDALAYCENLVLGGWTDWRLPHTKELEMMLDLTTSNPAADTTHFPNTKNGLYWTSTSCVGCHKFKAFGYNFSDGRLYFGIKENESYTRCVRSADDSDTTTTTSTAPTNPPCPTEEIYGETSPEVALLRNVRDTLLRKTPEGQELIKLYYQWSPFVVTVMKEDEHFKMMVRELLDEALRVLQSQ